LKISISEIKYVIGFAKRGLPHTFNSINLGDYNLIGYQTTHEAETSFTYPFMLVLPADQISSQ